MPYTLEYLPKRAIAPVSNQEIIVDILKTETAPIGKVMRITSQWFTLEGINYRNSAKTAKQAWDMLGWGMGIDQLSPIICEQRAKLLVGDQSEYRALREVADTCRKQYQETGDEKLRSLYLGFLELSNNSIFGSQKK